MAVLSHSEAGWRNMMSIDPARIELSRVALQQLELELDSLEQDSKASTATVVLDQSSVGRLSRMDALQGQQMALETARRRKQQLLAVKAALQRIDRGDYGYCLKCGEEIASGRLAFNPAATCCVDCTE